jgi:hypothetical protein
MLVLSLHDGRGLKCTYTNFPYTRMTTHIMLSKFPLFLSRKSLNEKIVPCKVHWKYIMHLCQGHYDNELVDRSWVTLKKKREGSFTYL